MFKLDVHTSAGHRGEETPRAFTLGNAQFEVEEVLDKWLASDHRYFKVRTVDGGIYILRHDTHLAQWELTFFTQNERIEPPCYP